MSYQGYLESAGVPVDGARDLTFRLYAAETGGAAFWTEAHTGVSVSEGAFSVLLGSSTDLPVSAFDKPLWLSVAVGDEAAPELGPRVALAASAYALGLAGPAQITSDAPENETVRIKNTATSGAYGNGLVVHSADVGSSYAVHGRTEAPGGRGVYGYATSTAGATYGVYGEASSDEGTGVYGRSSYRGVEGSASGTTSTNYGVYGTSNSPQGYGVYGANSASSGTTYGVYGRSDSGEGYGVYGLGQTTGVYGYGITTGVYGRGGGFSGAAPNYGVYGKGLGDDGIGVYGTAPVYGIYGYATANDGTTYAVYGDCPGNSNCYAGYFGGKVHVAGTLSKGGGSFEIDHPLDPEGQVLRHSFVESPDMMNVYNGNATTDATGYATVELPAYFEALNRDFRYQLTTIGSFSRAMIAEEIRGNRFVIRTEEPNVRVSWQVTGIRQDAWAEENRIVVEEAKRSEERGRYLHPSAFGLPRERGVDYDAEREAHLEAERTRLEEAVAVE
ncbi:MAG: hypothetical protein R3362_10300 [Rhodothermales bacterium]|nr:hypothetical protein [Rhodothermales bacterium]